MLNQIISFSLRNRILILFASALLLLAGTYVAINSEVDVFPDLNAPTVVVMSEAPGFAPDEIEKSVTYPIETAVNGATGVRRVRSSIAPGFSVVWVEFDWGTDIYHARQIVSEKLSAMESDLPQGVNPPVLGPQSSILGEIMIIGLTSDSVSQMELRTIADKLIRPRLLGIGGVSQITVMGGDVKEYQIVIDNAKLKHYGVSVKEVVDAATDVNTNINGGAIYQYGNEYIVKGDISTSDIDALGAAVVCVDNGMPVLLRDVAEVKIGAKRPVIGMASEKLKPAVLITVTKQPDTDTNKLTKAITEEISNISTTLPGGVNVSTDIFRQSDFINNSINNIQKALFEGAIFVIIVLFFFLMNLRTTLISLVALPLSILISIIALHLMGFTLNTMSLGGLAIAIGSLVDDAIVDVENVYKRLRQNNLLPADKRATIIDVVYHASTEVRLPIFNSSLIIIASFLPLFFLTGLEGRLLIPLGIAFIVALIASTIVALTLTPVLCSYLLTDSKTEEEKISKEPWLSRKIGAGYASLLSWSFNHKRSILITVTALFIGALAAFFTLGRSFLPSFNEGSFTINVGTMPGVSLEVSNKIGEEAEKAILSIPEITTVARKTGRAELDEHSRGVCASEFEAPYIIKDRPRREIMKELRAKLSDIPGTNVEIGQPISHRIDAMLSGTQAQIAVKLFGPDLNQLYRFGSQIKNIMSRMPELADINIEQQVNRPQLSIKPRREMLARYGITIADFNEFIEVSLAGKKVSQVYEDGYPFDLTVISDLDKTGSIEGIKNLMIDSSMGKIPLEQVADVTVTEGPNGINRENVSRRIIISANITGNDLRGAVKKIQEEIAEEITLPEGYHINYGGQFESEEKASRTLALTSIIALIIVFLLLYSEFKDLKESIVILINLPLAMIGGVFILLLTGGQLNIPAIIGFISLLGITTRNGMLLMSRYNNLEKNGVQLMERIRTGSSDRLNPIMMTALTTALALIPLAINGSAPGNEIQSPMAVVILGGLLSSTILNLLVLPILYYFIKRPKAK